MRKLLVTLTAGAVLLVTAVPTMVSADGGRGVHIYGFWGLWLIFPILMFIAMMAFMYRMFVRGGRRSPWQDSDADQRQ